MRAVAAAVVLLVLAAGCRAERVTAEDAATVAGDAVDAVPAPAAPAGGEVLAALDEWLRCAAQAADVVLDVVAEDEDATKGVLVIAHEGTASRRAVRAAAEPSAVACAQRALGDPAFDAVEVDAVGDAQAGARAVATVAGRSVDLVAASVNAFVVLGGGVAAPDLAAAVGAIVSE